VHCKCPLSGAKRTFLFAAHMSAFDPKRTSALVQLIAQNTMHAVLGRKEMATKEIEVAVVGGGIGGLAAAISLRRAGFDVHVYEQSRAMREVGAGPQVSPNASRVLHRLGLADELAKLGVRPLAVRFVDQRDHVEAEFDNGANVTAGVLIGADGIHSTVRESALRLQRGTHIQGMATANKARFHLPDGAAQRERDAKMAEGGTDWSTKAIAWIYGYDSAAAVDTGDLGLPPWAN